MINMRSNQNRTPKSRFAEHWQADEESLLVKLWSDHSIREIAPMLPNYSLSAIRAKANHLGLKKDFEAKKARGVRNITPTRRRSATQEKPKCIRSLDRPVIAFEPDGVKEFANAKEAAVYYGLKLQRVFDLIASAETTHSDIGFNYLI
jgi:hypothetical protein